MISDVLSLFDRLGQSQEELRNRIPRLLMANAGANAQPMAGGGMSSGATGPKGTTPGISADAAAITLPTSGSEPPPLGPDLMGGTSAPAPTPPPMTDYTSGSGNPSNLIPSGIAANPFGDVEVQTNPGGSAPPPPRGAVVTFSPSGEPIYQGGPPPGPTDAVIRALNYGGPYGKLAGGIVNAIAQGRLSSQGGTGTGIGGLLGKLLAGGFGGLNLQAGGYDPSKPLGPGNVPAGNIGPPSIPLPGGNALTQLFDPGSAAPPASETARLFNPGYRPSGAFNPLAGGFAPSGAGWGLGWRTAITTPD